ncbi:MAG: M28 family peptidase [Jiangellales bacterium]
MTAPAALLADTHLHELCGVSPDRRPGSPGNDVATGYVASELRSLGWQVDEQVFDVLDWSGSAGWVSAGRERWMVHPSPYASGAEITRPLAVARCAADLDIDLTGRIVLLLDELASEPLTPIDYPFYANAEHAAVIDRLVAGRARVVLAGTGRAPQVAGAVEPFPLIEDGRFPIATGNLTVADAEALATHAGRDVRVAMTAHRWPSHARNVVARLGAAQRRVLVVAHVDSKPGTPGAVDNASGVVVLLLLAGLLADRGLATGEDPGGLGVELLVVNGEDCYSAAGELAYLGAHEADLEAVHLVLNVDAVGYRAGGTAFSLYGLDDDSAGVVRTALTGRPRLGEGPTWFQSDHMVFAQRGRPAVAFTTDQLDAVMSEVIHTAHDTPAQVDVTLLVELAEALADLIDTLP